MTDRLIEAEVCLMPPAHTSHFNPDLVRELYVAEMAIEQLCSLSTEPERSVVYRRARLI